MGDADFWELLTKHGIAPDSATAIVKSHGSMPDADLWERLVQNGAAPDAATTIVQSRAAPTGITARDLARSAGQGATFGFSDELGLADREKQKAFAKAHPIADVAAKIGGGAILPLVATLGIPALATLGGVVGTSAVVGGLTGAGEADGDLADRAKSAGIGATTSAAGGALGYGAAKLLGGLGGALLSRFAPERAATKAVGKAASALIDDPAAIQAHMDAVNAIAPGGSSPATATVSDPLRSSQFLPQARGVGASPDAASTAQRMLAGQRSALQQGLNTVGAQIEQHVAGKNVPAVGAVKSAVQKFSTAIGGQHTPTVQPGQAATTITTPAMETAQSPPPDIRTAIDNFWTRISLAHSRKEGTVMQQMAREALERHSAENIVSPSLRGAPQATVTEVPGTPDTYSLADLRDALSQVRALLRPQIRKEIEANGLKVRDLTDAKNALADAIYGHTPALQPLDKQYSLITNELRQLKPVEKAVAYGRRNSAANDAYGLSAHSLGGSIHSPTKLAIANALLEKLVPNNRAAVADATARMVLTPGADIASLLNAAPKAGVVGAAARNGLLGPLPAAMRGLLFPADGDQPQ